MEALVNQIVARCQALLTGSASDDPTDDSGAVAVSVHAHALPIAETDEDKLAQVPYVVVRLLGFEEQGGKVNPVIRVMGCIYTHGSVVDGATDLLSLVERLRPLVDRGPGAGLTGYKILPPVKWRLGDEDNGMQPHPFYECTADLRFVGV